MGKTACTAEKARGAGQASRRGVAMWRGCTPGPRAWP